MDWLYHLFSSLCGQNPDHTSVVGGVILPCCQRCTGIYVGACIATLLHLCLRPALSSRFLLVHGLFILQMLPCGLYWLPQGSVLRSISGALFGFGVVAYLWLAVAPRWPHASNSSARATWLYSLALITATTLLPWLAANGGPASAFLIAWASFLGVLVLATLASLNLGVALGRIRTGFKLITLRRSKCKET